MFRQRRDYVLYGLSAVNIALSIFAIFKSAKQARDNGLTTVISTDHVLDVSDKIDSIAGRLDSLEMNLKFQNSGDGWIDYENWDDVSYLDDFDLCDDDFFAERADD